MPPVEPVPGKGLISFLASAILAAASVLPAFYSASAASSNASTLSFTFSSITIYIHFLTKIIVS